MTQGIIEWDALSIFEHVLRRVHSRSPRYRLSPLPQVDLQFRPFAGMNHRARLRDGRLTVRLSDLVEGASPQVIEALAVILLAKLYGHRVPEEMRARYRQHLLGQNVQDRILATRRARGRKTTSDSGPQGSHFDLASMFRELNARYFYGAIQDVSLAWSRQTTRVRMGHFDAAHHAIVISKSLDRADVPKLLVEYILYHEMLHVKHPVESGADKRSIHTKAFRAEERLFAGRADARKAMKALAVRFE